MTVLYALGYLSGSLEPYHILLLNSSLTSAFFITMMGADMTKKKNWIRYERDYVSINVFTQF